MQLALIENVPSDKFTVPVIFVLILIDTKIIPNFPNLYNAPLPAAAYVLLHVNISLVNEYIGLSLLDSIRNINILDNISNNDRCRQIENKYYTSGSDAPTYTIANTKCYLLIIKGAGNDVYYMGFLLNGYLITIITSNWYELHGLNYNYPTSTLTLPSGDMYYRSILVLIGY